MSKINGRLRVGLSLGLVTELLPFLKFMLQLGEGLRLKLVRVRVSPEVSLRPRFRFGL